jgi:hypothetical protein
MRRLWKRWAAAIEANVEGLLGTTKTLAGYAA